MAGPDKVNLESLSYVIYEHPDVDHWMTFADDFGFELEGKPGNGEVYLRGYGKDPYVYIARQAPAGSPKRFHAPGFVAQTAKDFDRACKLEGAKLVDISQRPGGGRMVSVPDINGFPVEIIYGREERPVSGQGVSNVVLGQPNVNHAFNKPRKGVFNRLNAGAAKIHKLGHFGYGTDNGPETRAWYVKNFNFKASDIMHKPDDPEDVLLAFYHLDLGVEYSDHHCLLIAAHHAPGKTGTEIHHSSFEVEDLDTQMMGHKWLEEKGYKQMWGVGRHVMGSQIFDYWLDTTGFVLEHYADSDVVNQDAPTNYSSNTPGAIWGPSAPTLD